MTHAELVPSVLRSTHLTDSLARAQQLAVDHGRAHLQLADVVWALLDDPEVALLWEGLDGRTLAEALVALAARAPDQPDVVTALLHRAGQGHGGLLTGIQVVAAVLRERDPVARLLHAHGLVAAPVAVEPEIPGFDLEEALSEEVEVQEESPAVDPLPAEPTGTFELPVEDGFEAVDSIEEPEPKRARADAGPGAPEAAAPIADPSETTWDDLPVVPSAPAPVSTVREGQVAHDIPQRMTVAVKVPVEARLAEGAPEDLASGMEGGSIQSVLVTKAMSVRLVAPDGGFLIEGSSPETQWVYGAPEPELQTEHAHWSWSVTPTTRGRRRLQLVLTARTVDDQGVAAETALPEQVVEVRVSANVRRSAFQVGMWAVATMLGGAVAQFGGRIVRAIEDLAGM